MGTVLRRTNNYYISVGSTRLITVPTSPATKVTLSDGYNMMYVANVGPSALAWGDTGLLTSSGGLLYYSMGKQFEPVSDGFSFYVIADSVSGTMVVNEFKS